MTPALKLFRSNSSPIGRAVFRSTPVEDLCLILSGFSEVRDGRATLKALVRPVVAWVWIGGWVLVLGTVLAAWPFRVREPARAPRGRGCGPLVGRPARRLI